MRKPQKNSSNHSPLFSIITVSYNEKLSDVHRTLSSIRDQSFSDYEVIMVDGDSSISPEAIFRSFDFPNSSFLREADLGIYNAMNKGIYLSSGIWIIFLNIKDLLAAPSVLSIIAGNLYKLEPIRPVVYCDAIVNSRLYQPPSTLTLKHLFSGGICHQSVIAHYSTLRNLQFDESYTILADRVWLVRQLYVKTVFKYIPICFSIWDHGGASSNLKLKNSETIKLRLRQFRPVDLVIFTLSAMYSRLLMIFNFANP